MPKKYGAYMRFFLSFFFMFSLSSVAWSEQGDLQIFLFKGDQIPQQKKIYIKDLGQKEAQLYQVFSGYKSLKMEEGEKLLSLRQKGPFYPVRVFSGQKSQVTFDLLQKDKEPRVYDDFVSTLDLSKEKLQNVDGLVVSRENGQPLQGVVIFLSGHPDSVKTDAKGKFSIDLPTEKKFSLSFVHQGFRSKTLEGVNIKNFQEMKKIDLSPSMGEMDEVVILAPKSKGSIEELLKERKNSKAVSVSIGSEQFAKSGDSSAATALKRVSGLSLVEGKFVYVRGLGERYSSTTLNGGLLPSPNPSRRVVPLDLFPTSLIESINIQKSYSVDKPAQFSAGLVEVRTLSLPKKNYFKLSFSTGASSTQILRGEEQGLFYEGGGESDFSGQDDGSRALPEEIARLRQEGRAIEYKDPFCGIFGEECTGFTDEELADLGNTFNQNYNTNEDKVGPNFGFSFEGGGRLSSGVHKAGLVVKGLYGHSNDFQEQEDKFYVISRGEELTLNTKSQVSETSSSYRTGGVISVGTDLFKRSKLEVTALATRSTENKVEKVYKEMIANEEQSFEITRLNWEERELLNFQLKGEHSLFENYKGPKLEWFWARSLSSRYRPDSKEYYYYLESKDFVARPFGNTRIFSDLKDVAKDFDAKLSGDLKATSWLKFSAFAGGRVYTKDRDSSTQRFTFKRNGTGGDYDLSDDPEDILNSENIESGEFQLIDSTLATDNYRANEKNSALYASLASDFVFTNQKSLSLITGVRSEDHIQEVRAYNIVNGEDSPDVSSIESDDPYMNYGLIWRWNKKNNLRLAYSETVSRPDLQEFAPVAYFNDEENAIEIGNPNLKIAEVQNFDIRWDYFFNNKEFISVGVFRKDISNPIETVDEVSTDDQRTFKNIERALNDGVELEFRKHLYKGLFLGGNYSLIKSEVSIDQSQVGASTNTNRPLQGQSPYLINLGLEYSNKKYKLDTALVFNMAGPRITKVGSNKSPDVYEEPFEQLDFTIRKKINKKISLGFKAQNLLNPLSQRTQGGEEVRSFKYGRAYSLTLSTAI